jgi:hypothetical protein
MRRADEPSDAGATTPVSRNVADYRPGGSAATAAGSSYKAIACTAGSTWNYSAAQVGSATIVYVPCNVSPASQPARSRR